MNTPNYDLRTNTEFTLFEFKSNGPNGEIVKGIAYSVTKDETLYNLGFGDLVFDPIKNRFIIDDLAISDNGDRNAVLATVAKSAYLYTEMYPDRSVFFKGSTKVRTRLYRRAISLNVKELSETFHIFGVVEDENGAIHNIPFDSNGDFYGFIIKRKLNENIN
ncbi:hypothetical protein Q1W71_24370 [Flavobacterium pectinovorum]|uniref:DUF6934 family protein n=1 Tax=Flavobacterium pectinovorum TaxID=29533 RepID=UPI00265D6BE6|nr:hypothetical protein [Flavobacterium pectinovorum]WKL48072.1 hypothetical protein Q1W71_24370 [Flavobacterium pectinovorum]